MSEHVSDSAEWQAVQGHAEKFSSVHLRELFDSDPRRGERLSAQVADLYVDYSKNLITDVVMPGMDGRQLAHRFLDQHPGTKVIFISGYAEALIDDQGRPLEPDRTILPKPFSSADLHRTLRQTLAAV